MKFSLKKKSILFVLVIALILSCVAVFIGYRVYSDTMDKRYEAMSMDLAKTAAAIVDEEKVRAYSEAILEVYRQNPMPEFETVQEEADYYAQYTFIKDEDYREMFNVLQSVKANNRDVQYLYLFTVDPESRSGVYVIDVDSSESACPMGTWDIIYPENYEIFENPERGFPAYTTETEEFDWLCSAGAPIIADDGTVVAYAMIEVSMNDVMADRANFLWNISLAMVGVTILLAGIFILVVNHSVVRPIDLLTKATGDFIQNNEAELAAGTATVNVPAIRTGDEVELLADSFRQMEEDMISYIRSFMEVTAEKERIGAELNVATQIQADMLPRIFPAFPERPEFDIYATMTPAKEVGGDFYDFFLVDDDHLAVVIADVSGKGVPAALFMVIAKTLIKNHAQNRETPADVFTHANEQLCEGNDAGLFVTAWMGILEISTGKFTYVNAGHNPPLLKRAGEQFEWLKSRPGFVLAGMEGVRYRENTMQLEPGDCLYLYTDGVTEATSGAQEFFGEERLQTALNDCKGLPVAQFLPSIKARIDAFVGDAEQFDDITMLALKYEKKEESHT